MSLFYYLHVKTLSEVGCETAFPLMALESLVTEWTLLLSTVSAHKELAAHSLHVLYEIHLQNGLNPFSQTITYTASSKSQHLATIRLQMSAPRSLDTYDFKRCTLGRQPVIQ